LTAPDGWVVLPPGDAALTRRVKEAGDHWVVQEKKGRKVFSRGVWASAATIERIRADLEAERSTEGYAKRKEADARRREKAQAEYVEDFFGAVVKFLSIRCWPGIPREFPRRRRSPGCTEFARESAICTSTGSSTATSSPATSFAKTASSRPATTGSPNSSPPAGGAGNP
jgi:hypothetical protein